MDTPTPFIFDKTEEFTADEFFNSVQQVTEAEGGLIFRMLVDDTQKDIVLKNWEISASPDMANVVILEELGKSLPVRVCQNWNAFIWWARDKARGLE